MTPGMPNPSGGNAKPATAVGSALAWIGLITPRDHIAQQICAIWSHGLYSQRNAQSTTECAAPGGMSAARLDDHCYLGRPRQDWQLRARRDVSTGYVLRGWMLGTQRDVCGDAGCLALHSSCTTGCLQQDWIRGNGYSVLDRMFAANCIRVNGFAARLDARRSTQCWRHNWMLRTRRDVSSGYVLCGWTCFLEEMTRDRLPCVVMNGVKLNTA